MGKIIRFLAGAATGLLFCSATAYAQMPGEGKTAQPIQASGVSSSFFLDALTRLALQKLGYDVKPTLDADYPAMHLAIAQGDADYTASHWVPIHTVFYEQAGGDAVMERVGKLIEGAGQGYFIDKATADKYKITNIAQLNSPELAKLFDSDGDGKANLAGCNPGWGCEREIEHQLDAYKLRDTVHHDQGSYNALMADVITRYQAKQPILYYAWTPNWIGSVLKSGIDVVQLDVPFSASTTGEDTAQPDGSNPGFVLNTVVFLGNKKFLEANPAVKKIFESMSVPMNDFNEVLLRQYKGENQPEQIKAQAEEWAAKNQATFDKWISDAAAAK